MLTEIHDDEIVAFGWPWHGLVRSTAGGTQHVLTLSDGREMELMHFNSDTPGPTWIYDAGRPDIDDPAVEAKGGKWWGRAIMRGGWFWSGMRIDRWGDIRSTEGRVPLCWPDEPDAAPQMILYRQQNWGGIEWLADNGNLEYVGFYGLWSLSELGQGTDQPLCAAKDQGGNWRLIGQAAEGFGVRYIFLGAYRNRLLFGLRLFVGNEAGEPLPGIPGASSDGGREALYGLIELEIDRALFGAEPDPQSHITLRVLEDRQTALGHPYYHLSDSQATDNSSRTRIETANETNALLTAWYAPNGEVRTARFNRYQQAEYRYRIGDARTWNTSRRTEFELLYNSSVVDARVLGEELFVENSSSNVSISRRVYTTGEPVDEARWADEHILGNSFVPGPPAVFRAGANLVMGAVAYIVTIQGRNVLREQDIRLMWLVAHSNNVASICASREPYDYPEGSDSYIVEAYSGPAIGPNGPHGASQTSLLPKGRGNDPWRRSFFALSRWLRGAGNPLTGEIMRGKDYYDTPQVTYNWV